MCYVHRKERERENQKEEEEEEKPHTHKILPFALLSVSRITIGGGA